MNRYWKKTTKAFFDLGTWKTCQHRGVPIGKSPLDLWIYKEIIERVKPALLIELGTWFGGSALYFHEQLQAVSGGKVISVDFNSRHRPKWPKQDEISYLVGPSTSPAIFNAIAQAARNVAGPVMVSADSGHRYKNVLAELEMYSPLVSVGSYYVVEDGVLDHVLGREAMGAWKAATDFVKGHPGFVADAACERMGISFHVDGWLKRVK